MVSYDEISPQHTLNKVIDSLTTGKIYRLKFRAKNSIDFGPFSDELFVGLVALPSKPASAPVRNEVESTINSIVVNWGTMADGTGYTEGHQAGRISGYKLYMAIGPSASFSLAYDGSIFRTVTTQSLLNLTTG